MGACGGHVSAPKRCPPLPRRLCGGQTQDVLRPPAPNEAASGLCSRRPSLPPPGAPLHALRPVGNPRFSRTPTCPQQGACRRRRPPRPESAQGVPTRREDPKLPQIPSTAPGRVHGHTGRGGLRRAAQWGVQAVTSEPNQAAGRSSGVGGATLPSALSPLSRCHLVRSVQLKLNGLADRVQATWSPAPAPAPADGGQHPQPQPEPPPSAPSYRAG